MIYFTAHGTPAPQGSKRHVGHGVMVESSKKAKPWREAVKAACLDEIAGSRAFGEPHDGPVEVRITFFFLRPKSAPKKTRTWPITRSTGDLDKLVRCTLDALVDAGLIRDDSQVVKLRTEKDYGSHAHAAITVEKVCELFDNTSR